MAIFSIEKNVHLNRVKNAYTTIQNEKYIRRKNMCRIEACDYDSVLGGKVMIGLNRNHVELLPHSIEWKYEFEKEKEILKTVFSDVNTDIQHIGSTALPIAAKPIIDILVGVESLKLNEKILCDLSNAGYLYRPKASYPDRKFFVKGDENARTHHLHIVRHHSEEWDNLISFRDYLLNHSDMLDEYEKMKLKLEEKYGNCRKLYTEGKTEFILKVIGLAKNVSGNTY